MLADSKRVRNQGYQKAWCFTLAHPTSRDEQDILDWIHGRYKTMVKYAIIGKENGTQGEFEHLQGYVHFITKWGMWQVRALLGSKAHWEPAKGTPKQNEKYCEKEGNVICRLGFDKTQKEKEKQDQHNYWNSVVRDAQQMSAEEFAQTWPKEWLIRRGAVERLMLDASKKRMKVWPGQLQHKNVWLWGQPGIGKSRWAHLQETDGETLKKNCNRWWDGMDVRSVRKVIIEDFPCAPQGDMHAYYLKIWGDRYNFTGEVKNSALCIDPGRFFLIVTSNYHPRSCFTKTEDLEAICRRFSVIEMTKKNKTMIESIRLDQNILSADAEEEEERNGEEEEQRQEITIQEALEALMEAPGEPPEQEEYPDAEW
jgi:hypothetical protein